jgi:hypothetical protein
VEDAVVNVTAGSPVEERLRWTNRSPADIAHEVVEQGFEVSADTVRRILTDELRLALRQAAKEEAGCDFPQRDQQFQHIARRRRYYERRGWPVLSIDTKKKEILGDFFHPGRAYTNGRVIVGDHDFVAADERLVPYGVFDTLRNEGLMLLARGCDTSELACDAIWRWWQHFGLKHYWRAPRLLLLCDCGGCNGYRHQRFKEDLCCLACRMFRDLEVAHYPPGCSKYNPIEHRLFCHVTRSLRAAVLKTINVARDFIARTTTTTGLHVVAQIARRAYQKGRKATREFLESMPIAFNATLPALNYTAIEATFL